MTKRTRKSSTRRTRTRSRRKTHAFVFPVPFAGIVVLVATIGLAYVWLGCRCDHVGRRICELEGEQALLRKALLNEQYRWTRLKTPEKIEEALTKHGLNMSWPRRDQIVRLFSDTGYQVGMLQSDNVSYARLERVVLHE